jgi:hypothetical protein
VTAHDVQNLQRHYVRTQSHTNVTHRTRSATSHHDRNRRRCRCPHEPFMDQQHGARDRRLKWDRHCRWTRLPEQWSSILFGLRGFGAHHPGETCRYLRAWEIARWSPQAGLAKQERSLPDSAATVLEVQAVQAGWQWRIRVSDLEAFLRAPAQESRDTVDAAIAPDRMRGLPMTLAGDSTSICSPDGRT